MPITRAPEERSPEEIEERKRQQKQQRLRQEAALRRPAESQTRRVEEKPAPPPVPQPAAKEAGAINGQRAALKASGLGGPIAQRGDETGAPPASGPAIAPAPSERRQTRETTKVEKLELGHFNAELGKYESVEGEHKVAYSELDKIERLEVESRGAAEMEKERAAIEMVKPDIRLAGPKEESKESPAAEIRRTLEEAREHNRPALVVQAILDRREREGPLDLLQLDEKRTQILQKELDARIRKAEKERNRLLARIGGEKDETVRKARRAQARKILLSLAFYHKVKGMLGRILGGFFGKLAGGLMKK